MERTRIRVPPVRICGITLRAESYRKIEIKDILWHIRKTIIKKATLIVGEEEYIMWDILTEPDDIIEMIKYQTYDSDVYYRMIKKWYSGTEIEIKFYVKEVIYLHYKFNKNHELTGLIENI